jgi:hypothetical protein
VGAPAAPLLPGSAPGREPPGLRRVTFCAFRDSPYQRERGEARWRHGPGLPAPARQPPGSAAAGPSLRHPPATQPTRRVARVVSRRPPWVAPGQAPERGPRPYSAQAWRAQPWRAAAARRRPSPPRHPRPAPGRPPRHHHVVCLTGSAAAEGELSCRPPAGRPRHRTPLAAHPARRPGHRHPRVPRKWNGQRGRPRAWVRVRFRQAHSRGAPQLKRLPLPLPRRLRRPERAAMPLRAPKTRRKGPVSSRIQTHVRF